MIIFPHLDVLTLYSMDTHHPHLHLPNYPSHSLPSNHLGTSRTRQPLSDSAGNSQFPTLAPADLYQDFKAPPPRIENSQPRYSQPAIVPSQPLRPPVSQSLRYRRNHIRKQRAERPNRNPIQDSSQYQQYRQGCLKDSDNEQKWPEDLEVAFLNGR